MTQDSCVSIVSAAYLMLLQIPEDNPVRLSAEYEETVARCVAFLAKETGHSSETVETEFKDGASKLRAQLEASCALHGSGEI